MYIPNQQDIEEFWENGYWISPKLINNDRISRLREAMERLFAGDFDGYGSLFDGPLTLPDDPLSLRRVVDSWWVNNEIRDMVIDPGLGRIAAELLKVDGVRLWADQAIIKPGSEDHEETTSGNVGWHQDASYWHISSTQKNMITAWIALQDTDLSNGGMRTLKGSQKWGLIEESDKFFDTNLDGQKEFFENRIGGEWIDEPCILKAGQASFHHSLCFHGSGKNLSSKPRFSVIGHYMPNGTKFTPSDKFQIFLPLLGPDPRPGQLLAEPSFPRVY